MKTKSAFDSMLQQKPVSNFPLRHMTHTMENPMYVDHLRKAFEVKPAKMSPWEKMGAKK